jgi:dipeptidase
VFQNEAAFLPEVTETWMAVERRLTAAQPAVLRTAETLIASGELDLACDYLTYYSRTELMNALALAESLAESIEARTRARFGIQSDAEPRSPEQIW